MDKSKRNYNYDLLRIVACISIILIHNTTFLYNNPKNSLLWWSGNIIQSIVRIFLPIFVVLSGSLLLDSKPEKQSVFYRKRFLKILIPFFIYNIIYLIFKVYYVIDSFELSKILLYAYMIIKGPIFEHFWFIYMLLGLYICTPYLQIMCRHLSQRDINHLLLLLMIIIVIETLLPSFNIMIGITNITFSGWVIYYLLGYILKQSVFIKEKRKVFYCLGLISFIITIIENKYHIFNLQGLYEISITMFFQVIAIFLFFDNIKIIWKESNKKILLALSNCSFEVYLIHGAVMDYLNRIINKIGIISNNSLVFHIIFIIFVIFFSFIVSIIIHNLIVKPLEIMISKIIDWIIKKGKYT